MEKPGPAHPHPPRETLWTLASNVTGHRRSAGLTQRQLADHPTLAVGRGTVSRWETGRCMPERDHLFALAAIFGITTDQLFEQRDWKRRR